MNTPFTKKYGPWAVVAGASEGLGAEFARQLAQRGLNVLLVARRAAVLDEVAASIRAQHGVEVRTAALDLSDPALPDKIRSATAGLEVGLLVYNAAYSTIGEFLSQDLSDELRIVDVNCRGPVILAHVLCQQMAARRRGGVILMSSIAAGQGSPLIATYAATKAFNLIFGEGLWAELSRHGIDVITCRAGATRTPGYERSQPRGGDFLLMDAAPVVRQTLEAIGRSPSLIPGLLNGASAFFMGRILPRRLAVRLLGSATRRMYER
ncbi:MAG: SDR family NAD(P)-dependent oxidoreductase [Polyangia bacterium]